MSADIDVDSVAKIETGGSAARFPVIKRIAVALEADLGEPSADFISMTTVAEGRRRSVKR
ncbi:MAG: hypothetical protein ACLPNY_07675 [Roseiarcus sp.]